MKTLTVAVPCYNSQDYMEKCVDSLLSGRESVEILIINDGSSDRTGKIADRYSKENPGIVRVIHQENKGHGGAINTALKNASGLYFKVVDSDDWVNEGEFKKVVSKLEKLSGESRRLDMMITNFVYDKEFKSNKTVMKYENVLPQDCIFTWKDISRFPKHKYLLMHSIIFRTGVLRECRLNLPEHTFYVDNIFVFLPLKYVKHMYYFNVTLYHYYIGRSDQSVNESIMIKRIDQQIMINKLMFEYMDIAKIKTRSKKKYMLNYLSIITTVTSVLLIRSGTQGNLDKKKELWDYIKKRDLRLYIKLRFSPLGVAANLPSKTGRNITVYLYLISRKIYGFN